MHICDITAVKQNSMTTENMSHHASDHRPKKVSSHGLSLAVIRGHAVKLSAETIHDGSGARTTFGANAMWQCITFNRGLCICYSTFQSMVAGVFAIIFTFPIQFNIKTRLNRAHTRRHRRSTIR